MDLTIAISNSSESEKKFESAMINKNNIIKCNKNRYTLMQSVYMEHNRCVVREYEKFFFFFSHEKLGQDASKINRSIDS